ncbi:MAG TPA: histidinol dehydrogenase, partial [Candidatus Thermoplasmatota archaeon]|nr:histidinol dehydrogenase [Candidatus Thermoplasmatota archaeon]
MAARAILAADETGFLPVRALADVDWTRYTQRAKGIPQEVQDKARAIVEAVRDQGDAAFRRWSKALDGVDLEDPFVSRSDWLAGIRQVPAEVRRAVDQNLARIRAFHRLQAGKEQRLAVAPGVRLGRRPIPFEAVGCYVPGGRASYPSTVLMTVTPARIAGCRTIIVATPPRRDGTVDPVVLYAAKAAGATH